MKKLCLISMMVASASLVACGSTGEVRPEPIVTYVHVKQEIPEEFLVIPPHTPIPVFGDERDVARWLIEDEKRVKQLETQILKIRDFVNAK
jgi:hypothetical protein